MGCCDGYGDWVRRSGEALDKPRSNGPQGIAGLGSYMGACALSCLQIVIGLLLLICGSLLLHYASDASASPTNSGVGIWGGIIYMLTGILGLLAVMLPNLSGSSRFSMMNTHSYLTYGLGGVAGPHLSQALKIINECGGDSPTEKGCLVNTKEILMMAAILVAGGAIMCGAILFPLTYNIMLGRATRCPENANCKVEPPASGYAM